MIEESNFGYFRKCSDMDVMDKVQSEYFTDDELEQYYANQDDTEHNELNFEIV